MYSFIREHIDPKTGRLDASGEALPDEKREAGKIRWAAGALDGVAGHHMGASEAPLRKKQVVKALEAVAKDATENSLRHLYELTTRESVLGVIDEVMEEVRKSARLEPERIHSTGLVFAREAPKREAVKFGMALLGAVQGPDDQELLTTLGVHDEFTLFAAVALSNRSDDAELVLFELAKRVDGWGRIHLVERLAEAQHPDVRAWLLRDGFRNSVMNEYLAYTAAMAGGLHTALAAETVDAELLRGAAGIFVALASGGPAEDLSDYPHAAKAIDAWLSHAEKQPLSLEVLEAFDALGENEAVAPMHRARLAELRRHPGIPALVERGLASNDQATFWLADQQAKRRGIETFEKHLSLLERGSGDASYPMFRMMQDATEATIERALRAAAKRIDLAKVATGPADDLGLGPAFAAHLMLTSVLQELARFPGRGTAFVIAALRSPVIGNRNAALRSLADWGRDRWPPEVLAAVTRAAADEPVADVKARAERVLAGGPFDDPESDDPESDDPESDD